MENYFQKFVTLFATSATKILLITENEGSGKIFSANSKDKTIHSVNPVALEGRPQLKTLFTKNNYDLVLIDQIWSKSQLGSKASIGSMPHLELLILIKENLVKGGQVIILERNLNYLKRPGDIFLAALNIFTRKNSMLFPASYMYIMKKTNFSDIKRFFLVPDIDTCNHVISSNRRPVIKFSRKSRSIPHTFPENISQWPLWVAVWLGIDKWLFPWQLMVARK